MNRQQKAVVVKDLKDKFLESKAAFLVGFKGLSVSQIEDLRKDLRECGGLFKVTKARLMKIATNDVDGIDSFSNEFKDQVGLIFVKEEVPAVAKVIVNFEKENSSLSIVSAFFESNVLSKRDIGTLASLPSKDVLISMLMGTLQAPATNFARLLNAITVNLVSVLKQVSEKGESKSGE